MHNDIYEHWTVKIRKLNIYFVHIKEKRNKIVNDFFKTIFFKKDYFEDETVKDITERLNRNELQWI